MKNVSLTMLLTAAFLSGCGSSDSSDEKQLTNDATPIHAMKIISVSNYDFSMGENPAVNIVFGTDDTNHCSLTMARKNIINLYQISAKNRSESISIDCNLEGNYYVQSSKHDTSINFKIKQLDETAQSAVIVLSFTLANARNGDLINKRNIELHIKDDNFISLNKKL